MTTPGIKRPRGREDTRHAADPAPIATGPETDDRTWYNRFYREESRRALVVPPEVVARYRKLSHPELFHLEKWFQLIGDVRGKQVLYLACGIESSGVILALLGGEVWALDLALEALRRQRHMAAANGTGDRTHFVAGSCRSLPFSSESFDVVVGIGIWHHLQDDLETPCSEVARVLKEEGIAVFSEPIARSRLLTELRKRVPILPPRDASHQCRPLEGGALERFARQFHVEAYPFNFLARFDHLLFADVHLEFAMAWRKWTTFVLHYLDCMLLRIPGVDHAASVVVFALTAP